jgi:capsular polysaccharide transport system permease protein
MRNPLFILTVVAPTLIALAYFGFLAPDVFVSEASFVIRTPQQKSAQGLGALFQSSTLTRSQDDSYTVQAFILSRTALQSLMSRYPVLEAFGNKSVPQISRFPGIDGDQSFEALFRFYTDKVQIVYDPISSISSLKVRAFTSEDSAEISRRLLELSEKFINDLNERTSKDTLEFAVADVSKAEQQAKETALALSEYRNLNRVFDPEKQSSVQLAQISKIYEDLLESKMELAQTEGTSMQSPRIGALRKRIQLLSDEVEEQTVKVVGGATSLAMKAAEYERLALDRQFADKALASALTSLEMARGEVQRKKLYLERIVEPMAPDTAAEPKRMRHTAEVLAVGLLVWGLCSMVLAGVKEHHD